MSCPFLRDDAAYVLGALDPDERQHYETHLGGCRECAGAVRSLAGLPGLLARLTPDQIAETEADTERPPPELLTSLHRSVRRERRTSRWRLAVASGIAAALLAVGGTLVALHDFSGAADEPQPSTRTVTMEAVDGAPVTAEVRLSERPWGTHIQMWCEYDGPVHSYPVSYVLVVWDTSQGVYQFSNWKVIPGQEATIEADTALRPEDIWAVGVRTDSGTTVVRGEL